MTNDGLSPNRPKRTIQQVIDSTALTANDVILVDVPGSKWYDDCHGQQTCSSICLDQRPARPAFNGAITLNQTAGVTLQNLDLHGGITLTGADGTTINGNTFAALGVTVSGGSNTQIVHNQINGGVGVNLSAGESQPLVEHNSISGRDWPVNYGNRRGQHHSADNQLSGGGIVLSGPASGLIHRQHCRSCRNGAHRRARPSRG